MLHKTIVIGLAAMALVAGIGPGAASVRLDSGLRAALPAAANWLMPAAHDDAGLITASLGNAPTTPRLPVPGGTDEYGVFGSVALPIGTLPASRQWLRVSATDFTAQYGAHCTAAACTSGIGKLLKDAALKAEGKPTYEALSLVNSAVNHLIRYRPDSGDNWATPVETAARGSGDCEDYAIAKMWLLRSIGIPADELQLVVLKDTRRGLYHAVLAVHTGGERYILDNLSNRVVTDTAFRNYQPVESFIGSKSYIHGFASRTVETAALATAATPAH